MGQTAKKKRLTQREKALNARVKKEMQEEGILPPDKPRLNRKKFAQEVIAEFENMDVLVADIYLRKAVYFMVSAEMKRVSAEQVGVLKLLKIAVESEKFMKSLEEEGREKYTIGEYSDKVIQPIRNL